jgi:mannose-6-phosphate isomerase-like protein (cupin superfamily)
MNPFSLGLRNLLGVLLPGALLVLVLLACFALLFPDVCPLMKEARTDTDKAALLVASAFLTSYVIGSVIRLYASDTVDRLSAWLIWVKGRPFGAKSGKIADLLRDRLTEVTNPNKACPWEENLAQSAWKYDRFPYPVWEYMKFRLYHPPEMFAFYKTYESCFATGDRRGKEFFNYCKSVICSANEGKKHALAEEVQAAEADVRFLAGTFWAAVLSFLALLLTFLVSRFQKSPPEGAPPAAIAAAILMVLIAAAIVAFGKFRFLRLKEVDTVFDAFYLVHRHAAQCSLCSRSAASGVYEERQELVENAFSAGMSLQQLAAHMRLRSHNNPVLSSLYFAGADRDHPYFLHTDRVAVGIAVLPEDEPKSIIAKKHPHQTEIVVVLDGEMYLDTPTDGTWHPTDLAAGGVKVIPPGECHRIRSKENKEAAFLFIKTHPAEGPREEPCSEETREGAG